jgi:hypothetical protein
MSRAKSLIKARKHADELKVTNMFLKREKTESDL